MNRGNNQLYSQLVCIGLVLSLGTLFAEEAKNSQRHDVNVKKENLFSVRSESAEKVYPEKYEALKKALANPIVLQAVSAKDNSTMKKVEIGGTEKLFLARVESLEAYRAKLESCEKDPGAKELAKIMDSFISSLLTSLTVKGTIDPKNVKTGEEGLSKVITQNANVPKNDFLSVLEKEVNTYILQMEKILKAKGESFKSVEGKFKADDEKLVQDLREMGKILWAGKFRDTEFPEQDAKKDDVTKGIVENADRTIKIVQKVEQENICELVKASPTTPSKEETQNSKTEAAPGKENAPEQQGGTNPPGGGANPPGTGVNPPTGADLEKRIQDMLNAFKAEQRQAGGLDANQLAAQQAAQQAAFTEQLRQQAELDRLNAEQDQRRAQEQIGQFAQDALNRTPENRTNSRGNNDRTEGSPSFTAPGLDLGTRNSQVPQVPQGAFGPQGGAGGYGMDPMQMMQMMAQMSQQGQQSTAGLIQALMAQKPLVTESQPSKEWMQAMSQQLDVKAAGVAELSKQVAQMQQMMMMQRQYGPQNQGIPTVMGGFGAVGARGSVNGAVMGGRVQPMGMGSLAGARSGIIPPGARTPSPR